MLSSDDLSLLGRYAISAALQAGRMIAGYARSNLTVNSKKGGESHASQVVTEVDFLSQEIILETLLPTCERFALAMLAEESPDSLDRLEKDYFWCIDPLDGTLPFIESTPGYAVSIGLVSRQGSPQIGVVFDPVERILYYAIKDQGAFSERINTTASSFSIETVVQNSKPMTISASIRYSSPLTLICDRSFGQRPYYAEVKDQLKKIAEDSSYTGGLDVVDHGGAAMNACWVLEKQPACYFKFPKSTKGGGSLWDYAATAYIFLEAGATVCDMFGNPLDLNRRDSTFMNHRGVLYSSSSELAQRILDWYAGLRPEHE